MKHLLSLGALLVVFLYTQGASAQATDPMMGTWELNVAKSKFSPGPAPKSQTRTYEASGAGVKYSAKGVDAEGKPTLVQYTASFDGKDYPISGSPDSDTISLKKVDANTIEATQKKAGKVVLTSKRAVSKDGKTMTVTNKGTNAKGQAVDNVLVLDKK